MHSVIALGALIAAAEAWQQGPPGYPFHGQPPHYPSSFPSACPSATGSTVTVTSTVSASAASVAGTTLSTVKGSSSSSSSAHNSTVASSATHSITSAASTTSTFSIPTASNAASTASGLNDPIAPAEHIVYSTVGGYFLQDLNTTNSSTFDYISTNFGLINQTYPGISANLSQWQQFDRVVFNLNQLAPSDTTYKLLFIGRHGEGYHNAEQTYVGTPAWNCFFSEIDGNASSHWNDAPLDQTGINQAIENGQLWTRLFEQQGIEAPQSYYTSPLTRCLQTANYTYGGLSLPSYYPFVPTVKEFFRESISIHTCDRRSNRTYIAETFPTYIIDPLLSENDEIWNGLTAETNSAQDYRSKIVLDELFASDPATIISITTHSGEGGSLLRVLGHQAFSLSTGAIIPVLVKAQFVSGEAPATTTQPWQASSWCTNGPPLSSQTDAPYACVCSNGVAPVATTAPASILYATA